MKATGVVRRIDDLGRVVIPKEIRKTLRIKEGEPLEIFTDREGQVILKKYSPIGELSEFATGYAETLSKTTGHMIEDGKITDPVRGATLIGNGKDTLLKIDMVADNMSFGYGMCGSASGSISTCVGQPTIRVKAMTVGGKGGK